MNKLFLGFAVFAMGMTGLSAASAAGVEVSLQASQKDSGSGVIEYALTNDTASTIHVLRYMTPVEGLTGNLFRVSQNGEPVAYAGPMYKRVAPRDEDYIALKPGDTLRADVDLTAYYDMRKGGQYEVSYAREASDVVREAAQAQKGGAAGTVLVFEQREAAISIYADASPNALEPDAMLQDILRPDAGSNSFVGCSNTRKTQLATARTSSVTYANNGKSYLTAGTQGSRYTWWFGTYNSTRYSTVRTHFNNLSSALTNSSFTFDCTCTDSGVYAFVNPSQPYYVTLCGAFWSAPNTGTDSRAGTLVHETSHFNVVASTDDWAYGQSAAHSLALSNPAHAIDNADSHEYFAENNPVRN